jgi:hypothetical protein
MSQIRLGPEILSVPWGTRRLLRGSAEHADANANNERDNSDEINMVKYTVMIEEKRVMGRQSGWKCAKTAKRE